jgi:citrate synthase
VHENIRKFIDGFRYDAHPMSMLCTATVGALSELLSCSEAIYDPHSALHLRCTG